MNQTYAEDRYLEDALRKQRELMDYYKLAGKQTTERFCKELFGQLREALDEQVGRVAQELARHRMERDLGHPIDHEH